MRVGPGSFLVGGMVVLEGCVGGGEAPGFVVTDSAGIQIAESHRPAWEDGSGWTMSSGPAIRLGVVDGDPALQFDGVTGLARMEDGTIVVADGGSQQIRFFDGSGGLKAVAGGGGEGPGEFTGLSGLGTGSGGSIWAYDFSLRRVTWLTGAGEVERIVSLASLPPVLNSVGHLADGTFLLKQLWGATEVSEATETGFRRDPVAFVRFDGEGALVDTLGLFPGRELVLTDEDGRGVMNTPPFAHNSVGTLWGDGVVVGTQTSFELVQYTPDGEATRVARLPGWELDLGAGELEAYVRGRLEGVPQEERAGLREALESMPVPASKPAYGGLIGDGAGNLWVGQWTMYPDVPDSWNVLDPSGRWLGEVAMPGRFFPYAIGDDWILGVEWDDLDVEYVVLYPLLKEPANG